jgi:hypothetical protein
MQRSAHVLALSFLTLLTGGGTAAALAYAQQHFGPFKVFFLQC